jgi:hypothetical protein
MQLCDRLLGYYGWRDPREIRCSRPAGDRHRICSGAPRPGPLPWPKWRELAIWADGSHLADPAWLEAEALSLRR